MTVLNGTDYAASVKEAYDLVIRQPAKFLVLVCVSINNYVFIVIMYISKNYQINFFFLRFRRPLWAS